MKSATLSLAVLALALGACSKQAAEPEAAPPPAQAQAPQKTVFDTQLKSLQKAKDVQKTVDRQKAELDQQLKDEGG